MQVHRRALDAARFRADLQLIVKPPQFSMATMAVISFVVLAMSDCASAFFSYITSPPECMTIALAALVSGASDTAYARAENAANSALQ